MNDSRLTQLQATYKYEKQDYLNNGRRSQGKKIHLTEIHCDRRWRNRDFR